MHPLTFLLVVLVAVARTSSDESSNCPAVDAVRSCKCWNSDVTCDDLEVTDFNFLQLLPPNYTRLSFSRNNLRAVQGGDLAAFANITSLTMQHNQITRFDSEALAPLVMLEVLNLAHNQLHEFDLGDVNLPRLSTLDVSDNYLLRLKLNPSLKRLTSVILERNRLQLSEEIFAFPNIIDRLKLSGNRVGNNLKFLKHLSKVKTLWLSENLISEISEKVLEKNMNIEYLRLDSNSLTNVNFLKYFPFLRGLNLTNNKLDHIPVNAFQNMSNLIHLYMGQNRISDIEFLANINNKLGILFLSNNNISQISSSIMKGKKGLRRLSLSYNDISDLHFLSELPILEILLVDNNFINSIHNYQFNKSYLNFLDLSNNYIEHVDFIPHSRYLKYLSVADSKISKINPHVFVNSRIEDLDLSGNELRNLDFIRSLSTIKNLYVTKCNITTIPEDVFRDNPTLEKLDISENHIENMDFVFYTSHMRLLITSNCSIESKDGSPLKCSRSVDIHTPHRNSSLSFIKSTNELWERCYGKLIVPDDHSTRQWTVLTTITILSLVCLVLFMSIIFLETVIRFRRKRHNAYFEIQNEAKKTQC